MNFLHVCSFTFCEYNALKIQQLNCNSHIYSRTNARFSSVATTLQIRTAAVIFQLFFFTMWQQPPVDQGLIIMEDLWSHSDTPHSEGLLWTNDQHAAEASTWQQTKLTRHTHPCPRLDSSPQSPQAKRPQTHAFDCAATGIGIFALLNAGI